jgi:hypothetical protein
MSSCSCASPCSGSINCTGGCGCLCDSASKMCQCVCQTFTLDDLQAKSEPLGLLARSNVKLQLKNLSVVALARFLSYHAPSLNLYIPASKLEESIDYESSTPEMFEHLIKTLGLKIIK